MDYREVCANQTGRFIPDAAYVKARERREQADQATVAIAKALECRGGRFYYGEDWADRCTVIGLFSGAILPLPATRRVNFFPAHAAQQRAKMLRDVEHFADCYGAEHCHMYTITRGQRVDIDPAPLREAIQAFHRRLSKLAAHPTFKRFGIRMQWAATEFGSPQWNPETGRIGAHIHSHCLVTEPQSMSKKRRGKLRKKLWRVFGVHWDDSGPIQNIREFVKYPMKPADLDRIISEAGPGVLCDFYDAVKGLHISRPMGDLRRIRSIRRAKPSRLVRMTVENEGSILAEKADWNAGHRPMKDQGPRRRYLKRAERLAQSMPKAESMQSADEYDAKGNQRQTDSAQCKGPNIRNRIIARLAPAPYGGPILEPAVVVWGFDGDLDAIRGQRIAADIIAAHRAAWADAEAARALIHACALDAGARAPGASEGSQRSDNCPEAPPDWQRELALAAADDGPPGQN
ncbi:MAG: hypothetical protein PHQ12_15000 [Chthoniobacteraceae bacterium]|nr:hypothetical protein [Chthoniobacteraceae bacterium]